MPTYRFRIEYDGTDFYGWQIQEDVPTVQQAVQDALTTALGRPVTIYGSGRTDSGVHARGQVAHFHLDQSVDTYRLKAALNGILPPTVAVSDVQTAPEGFHARFHARRRRYHYYVSTQPVAIERKQRVYILPPTPDFKLMNKAARSLVGTKNFKSFCRTNTGVTDYICTVKCAQWVPDAGPGDWRFEVVANRYLHGMVRAIVGTLLEVGKKERSADNFSRLIDAQDRLMAGPSAPAEGLILEKVYY